MDNKQVLSINLDKFLCIAVGNEIWLQDTPNVFCNMRQVLEHAQENKGENISYLFILNEQLFKEIHNNFINRDIDYKSNLNNIVDKFQEIASDSDYIVLNLG